MTRINITPVQLLSDKHLLAEYKEVTRPFNKAYKRLVNNKLDFKTSESYTLNTGHETFFFNKLQWLFFRYHELRDELLQRNFNIDIDKFTLISNKFYLAFEGTVLWNWYEPTPEEVYLNMARLVNRCTFDKVIEEADKGRLK